MDNKKDGNFLKNIKHTINIFKEMIPTIAMEHYAKRKKHVSFSKYTV